VNRIGRYELVGLLGEGGAGRVYEAVLHGPDGLRRTVALKILRDGAQALRREARLGGLLRHRNLVDVYEIGEDHGVWFCAMERCAGTLAAVGGLSRRAVVEVGLQVCDALAYAHEELGLVHLDLKPDNLLYTATGEVKVADLGVARAVGFEADRMRGTPGYIAPEQALGGIVDARSDIYALGITLVELATGARHRASATVDWDSLGDTPSSRSDVDQTSDIPRWLEPAVRRCLESAPDDRWPDMGTLAQALSALEVGGPSLRDLLDDAGLLRGKGPAPSDSPPKVVGRDAECAAVLGALAEPGMVVVLGPGGIGKTHLAREVARRWPGPALFCELSATRTLDGLLYAVAQGLGVRADSVQHIAHVLAGRGPLLLVLDSFDLLAPIAAHVQAWRTVATELRVLITSQAPVNLDGIERHALGPLTSAAAMELMIGRAAARGVELAATPALEALAAQLDGHPLALSLAAGRLGVLTVEDVLQRLGPRLLRSGSEGRHSTIDAALDWGWELLDDAQRAGMTELSVFTGSFTRDAAEHILDLPDPSATIGTLIDRAMVRTTPTGRLEVPAMILSYARARLEDEGIRDRHAAWYAKYGAPEALSALRCHGAIERLRALRTDFDNILSACHYAIATESAHPAIATLKASEHVIKLVGPHSVTLELASRVLSMDSLSASQRAYARLVRGSALLELGRPAEARTALDAVLTAAVNGGWDRLHGLVLAELGALHHTIGQSQQAIACFRAAQETLDPDRDHCHSDALNNEGVVHHELGQFELAQDCFDAAHRSARHRGDGDLETAVLLNQGRLHLELGDPQRARALFEDAHRGACALGDTLTQAGVDTNLGNLWLELGDVRRAEDHLNRALTMHRQHGSRSWEASVLTHLARVRWAYQDADAARAHYRRAASLHAEIGEHSDAALARLELALLELQERRLDDAERTLAALLPTSRDLEHRLLECAVTGHLGEVYDLQSRGEPARAHLARALALARELEETAYEGYWLSRLAYHEPPAVARVMRHDARHLLVESGDIELLARFLATRAEQSNNDGDTAQALATLAEADALGVAEVATRFELQRVRALLSAPPH
jgi:tetratricopeptide (TPR) repeat protein